MLPLANKIFGCFCLTSDKTCYEDVRIHDSYDNFFGSFIDIFQYKHFSDAVMALTRCDRCGPAELPLKYIRKWPHPTQDIALFFRSSTRMSMVRQK